MIDKWCPTCEAIVESSHTHSDRPFRTIHPYRWRKISKRYLAMHPCCHDCEQRGITHPATEVHHILKPGKDQSLLYDYENLMSLCKRHHSIRTQRGE